MGKVRPEQVKKIAKALLEQYPQKFTTDFENNKKVVTSLIQTPSIKLRNRIAGYVTHLLTITQTKEKETETSKNVE